MSLFSTFYFGESSSIVERLQVANFNELDSDPHVVKVDFSGGVQNAFLMPEDFGRLVKPSKGKYPEKHFMRLLEPSKSGEEESGIHVVTPVGITQIATLTDERIASFNDAWNDQQEAFHHAWKKKNTIWRNKTYWKLAGGVSVGLTASGIIGNDARIVAIGLGVFTLALLRAWFIHRKRSAAPAHTRVNWVPLLKELRDQFSKSSSTTSRVVYYCSL